MKEYMDKDRRGYYLFCNFEYNEQDAMIEAIEGDLRGFYRDQGLDEFSSLISIMKLHFVDRYYGPVDEGGLDGNIFLGKLQKLGQEDMKILKRFLIKEFKRRSVSLPQRELP